MSALIDQLLSQQLVLIGVGLALLFIVAAVGVGLYPGIKARRAKARKRRETERAAKEAARLEAEAAAAKAEQAARRAAARDRKRQQQAAKGGDAAALAGAGAAAGASVTVVNTVIAPGAATPTAPAAPEAATPAPTPAALPASPAATKAGTALTAALTGGTPAPAAEKKEEVNPAMQDLLSSVFADEENSERQAMLLKGTLPVAIDELLTLSKAVMAQLQGEQPTNLVRVKEKELV